MNLYWGVTPYVMPLIESVDEVIQIVDAELRKQKRVKKGDGIVIIMGAPIYHKGTTNLIKLHCIN
jgi:pyruvate kinase